MGGRGLEAKIKATGREINQLSVCVVKWRKKFPEKNDRLSITEALETVKQRRSPGYLPEVVHLSLLQILLSMAGL